ncbi:S-phase kinase-associated protein 2 isoform X2 [Dermacentor albipictus]|uniref:S-phase kinase-associated protein 2 isoform X2 n=1 Tax=Dermacentor albipictus TaxID=60249 RepID=UPI0031FBF723
MIAPTMDREVVALDYSTHGSKKRSPLQDISTNQPPSKRRRSFGKRSNAKAVTGTDIENVDITEDSDDSSSSHDKWGVDNRVPTEILKDMGIDYLEDESPQTSICTKPPSPPRASRKFSKGQKRDAPSASGTPSRTVPDTFTLHKRSKQDTSSGKDPFEDFSDETILEIFKWLPKPTLAICGRVCRRWMAIAFDESLWRRLDLSKKHLGPGVLGNALNRGVVVLRLATAEIKSPIFTDAPMLSYPADESWPSCKVQYLDLSMASISEDALCELLASCSNLKKLSLEQCTLNDRVCRLIGANHALESLNMSMASGFTHLGIASICRGCKSLTSWNLAWTKMTTACIDSLVLTATPVLQELNIAGCRSEITNDHVSALVERCPHLLELDLSDATEISCDAMRAIVNGLPELQHLCISRCYSIAPTTFLSRNARRLFARIRQFALRRASGSTAIEYIVASFRWTALSSRRLRGHVA